MLDCQQAIVEKVECRDIGHVDTCKEEDNFNRMGSPGWMVRQSAKHPAEARGAEALIRQDFAKNPSRSRSEVSIYLT